jgi:hypothetical protein
MHPTLTAALDYARLGYRVIPLKPGSKVPDLRHWPEEASNDPDVVARHFASSLARARAEARRSDEVIVPNVGIVTGNGLAVLDVDKDHGGKRPSWAPDTMTVQTASGGYHFYYAVDRPIPNSVGRRARGGAGPGARGPGAAPPAAIVLPVYHKVAGERVYSTSEYKLVYDRPIAKIEADLLIPEDVRQDFTGRLGRRFEYRDEVPVGQRNNYLTSLAGYLFALGEDPDDVLESVELESQRLGFSPKPGEVAGVVASVRRYHDAPSV